MPTYTYQCQSCGVQFERFQKFSEKALTRCPECRSGKVKRLLQPAAIVFKGSGWYSTDHRSSASKAAQKTDTQTNKPESKTTKKETKPAKSEE